MLVELLHKVAQMEDEDREPVDYYPRPSMAGPDRCIRQMVYLARGEEKEKALDGRVLHIFNDGHWHEELTIEWIQKTAFTLHSQQMRIRVSMQGLTIGGSIDGISYRRGHLWRGKRRRTPINAIIRKWTDLREHSHNPETWGTL